MMDSRLVLVNVMLLSSAMTISAVGLLGAVMLHNIDPFIRKLFISIFALLCTDMFFSLMSVLALVIPWLMPTLRLDFFMFTLASALLMPLISIYILYCCGEDHHSALLFRVVKVLLAVYIVLLAVTQFTGSIYYFDDAGAYRRGPFFSLLLVPAVLIMMSNLAALLMRKKKLTPMRFLVMLICIVMPIAGMLVQMAVKGLYSVQIGTTIGSTALFVFMAIDQSQKQKILTEERTQNRINLALLQMRPHFIYNTLTGIYYLVGQDREKAQQAILDFTNYLRKNFSAITKTEPIPFTEELEHVRAYLAAEQIRFSDKLYVEYDTPVTDFKLPALSIQPLVENAVKHGMSPEKGPLTIKVATRETEGEIIIEIKDNGGGFDTKEKSEGYSAIDNISERLSSLYGGRLDICSVPGDGTTATIVLPKENKK